MDIRHLELFISIAEEGSIHGGARRMMVAQPAASRALRALERELRTELLVRSPRGIELTAAGRALLDEATNIMRALDNTVEMVQNAARAQRRLVVGLLASVAAAAEITREIVQSYRERFPEVQVIVRELDFPTQFQALESGEIDAAILRTPCTGARVTATPLFEEPLVLAMRSDHRLSERDSVTTEEILTERMLDLPGAPGSWKAFWHLNEMRHGDPVTGPSARTLSELQMSLITEPGIVIPITLTAWRLSEQQRDLRGVRLAGAPYSTAVVVVREHEARDYVLAFAENASRVARRSLDRIPGARLPDPDVQIT